MSGQIYFSKSLANQRASSNVLKLKGINPRISATIVYQTTFSMILTVATVYGMRALRNSSLLKQDHTKKQCDGNGTK